MPDINIIQPNGAKPKVGLPNGACTTASSPISPALDDAGLVDGDIDHDIAICGFSIKFPQEATSSDAFWDMMIQKRCAMTEFPPGRLNKDGFHQRKPGMNTFPVSGGHFFQEDPAVFDADFFSISPAEAASMDPMQRWLLETAHRALENGMNVNNSPYQYLECLH